MARLTTLWQTDDPQIAASLKAISSIPVNTPEHHEALAGLLMLQARWEWRDADRLRAAQRQAAVRAGRRVKRTRGDCPSCLGIYAINADGTLRKHQSPAGTVTCPGSRKAPAPEESALP